jgi:hypothetical protein
MLEAVSLKRAGIFFMIIMLFVTVVLSACQSDNNELIPDDELYKRKLTIVLRMAIFSDQK